MKTQELKSYIDRVLGNSIRCLLPSYWWKRVFGAVIDNTISKDEVKTINGESILGEGDLRVGVKSVESVEALEKLDAVVGDIATVGASVPIQVKIADCYYSVDFEKDWDKYTAITRVEEIGLISDTEERAVNLYKFKDGRYVSTIIIGTENGYRVYKISKNDTYEDISLEEINGILAKNEYRFGIGYRWADIDSFFRFYTNSVSADAYIKGDSWTRLLKDGDVTGGGADITIDSELSDTSENAVQNKVVTSVIESIALELGEMVGDINTSKADKTYVDEKLANIVASSFVIDLTVDEIEDAISNNGGVIDYTLNRELIIDALSKNIPMVVRIGEHSNGYCLAQGELDGADTLTITFNHSQYKYSILIGDESIEVDKRNVESFVTSTQLDSAIAQAITNTLNTEA